MAYGVSLIAYRLLVKILHRHILASHLLSLGLTLVVFTFVLLLGNIFKELVDLMANRSVSILTMGHFFVLLLPYILSFSMPMALMAATLLVVGRVSADNELTACRACGVSFFEVALPLFGVAAVLSFVSLYVNCSVAPRTKYLFNRALIDIALKQPIALLEQGQWIKDFPGMRLYIGERDIRSNTLRDVRVIMMENHEVTQDIHAQRGAVSIDPQQLILKITLYNARIDQRSPDEPESIQKRKWGMTVAEYPLALDMTHLINQRRAVKDIHHYSSVELWKQMRELKSQGAGHPTPHLVELHKRFALSFACIAFVLVALPLGIQTQRREASIGILMSLVLAVFYYFLILFAESFKKSPHLCPEFIVWIPNLIFEGVGLFLLWRQSRI